MIFVLFSIYFYSFFELRHRQMSFLYLSTAFGHMHTPFSASSWWHGPSPDMNLSLSWHFIRFNSFILPTFILTDWWTRSSWQLGLSALSELCRLRIGGLGYFCFFSVYVHLECAIEYSAQERYQLCSITVACLIEQFYYESTFNLWFNFLKD